MSRKAHLASYKTIDGGDMSGDLTSSVTNIEFLDNIGIQLNIAGTATGTFDVQISADFSKNSQGVVINQGNWVDLALETPASATGSSDTIYIDLNQLSAPWIRLVYNSVSGSGTVNAFIVGKQI